MKQQHQTATSHARALRDLTGRYLSGEISRRAWTTRMRREWATITATGLRRRVMQLTDPLRKQHRKQKQEEQS